MKSVREGNNICGNKEKKSHKSENLIKKTTNVVRLLSVKIYVM